MHVQVRGVHLSCERQATLHIQTLCDVTHTRLHCACGRALMLNLDLPLSH